MLDGLLAPVKLLTGKTEPAQRAGLAVPGVAVAEQRERGPLLVDGVLQAPLTQAQAAEVGVHVTLTDQVAVLAEHNERAGVVAGRFLIVAVPIAGDAEIDGCPGFASAVAELGEQSDRLHVVPDGLSRPAQPFRYDAQVTGHARLANPVRALPVQRRGLRELIDGLLAPALLRVADREVGERVGLAGQVSGQAGRVPRMAVDDRRLGVAPAGLQKAEQGLGQRGDVLWPALAGGGCHG